MFNWGSPVQPPCSVCQHRWFLHLSVFGGLLRQRTHLLAQESPTVQGCHVLQLQTLQKDEAWETFILESNEKRRATLQGNMGGVQVNKMVNSNSQNVMSSCWVIIIFNTTGHLFLLKAVISLPSHQSKKPGIPPAPLVAVWCLLKEPFI